MIKDCQFTLAAIEKTLPKNVTEFDDYRVVKGAGGKSSSAAEPSDCEFGQALELSATEGEMSRQIEVKNE